MFAKYEDFVRQLQLRERAFNQRDDYIVSIVSTIGSCHDQFIIVSTDSDFIQLVNDTTSLYVPKGKEGIVYDEIEVQRKYNILPSQYTIFKSLVGDKSDNIKGIRGIGTVTAAKVLKYGTIQSFIDSHPNSRFSKLLVDNRKVIDKNNALITMNKNLDVSQIVFKNVSLDLLSLKTYEIIEKIGER